MDSDSRDDTRIRALAQPDLDAVVDIDAAVEGRTRRAYFQRRLAAALKQPALHLQLAAVDASGLAGYILARRTSGEFGRTAPGLRLEVVGVREDRRGHGVGRQLLDALTDYATRHGVTELRTTAVWTNTRMLRWLRRDGLRAGARPRAGLRRRRRLPGRARRRAGPAGRRQPAGARSTTARPRPTTSSASASCWRTCARCIPKTCRRSAASTARSPAATARPTSPTSWARRWTTRRSASRSARAWTARSSAT